MVLLNADLSSFVYSAIVTIALTRLTSHNDLSIRTSDDMLGLGCGRHHVSWSRVFRFGWLLLDSDHEQVDDHCKVNKGKHNTDKQSTTQQ